METSSLRLQRWDAWVRTPLVVLGVLFIVGFSIFILVPDLPPVAALACLLVVIIAWLAFVIDYIVRVGLARRGGRRHYIAHHPLELLAVVLPIFRAVRVVHLTHQLPYFQRRTGAAVRATIIAYAATYVVVFVYFIALTTLWVERDAPGATITSFGNAIWWAFVTLSTVGYGDVFPVTGLGRFYAVLLMMSGILVIGVISGTIVSYISDRIRPLTGSHAGASEKKPEQTPMSTAGGDPATPPASLPADPPSASPTAMPTAAHEQDGLGTK